MAKTNSTTSAARAKARTKAKSVPVRHAKKRHASDQKQIIILGAKEHNLQNVDISLPRDQLVVITGLSGSGKS